MLGKEGHIFSGGTAGAKAGRSLNVICAGLRHDLAQFDLLLVRQEAALDDNLQQLSVAGILHFPDLIQHIIPFLLLDPTQIDDHVHFFRAVFHGIVGHEALGSGGVISVGKADHGTDRQLSIHILRNLLHKTGRNAHAGTAILHAVIADRFDLLPGSSLGQQRMVAFA